MPRSPITEQYQRLMSLVEQLHGLPEDERNFVLDLFVPLPEPEQVEAKPKRGRKKGAKGASKLASSIAAQITKNPESKRSTDEGACTFVLENGQVCNTGDNNPIHDKSFGYAGYHEFRAAA